MTPKDRRNATLNLLAKAADEFASGRYRAAAKMLEQAKELSPRAPTIRELLGLSAYRAGLWDQALRELRTFRRLAGDTTHMAVEMDALRALGRPREVEKTWDRFFELGGSRRAENELRVVYGGHLLDVGDPRGAWEVTNPGRISSDARESDLRRWYVAARAAARLGDADTARKLKRAIEKADTAFPGIEELEEEIRAAG